MRSKLLHGLRSLAVNNKRRVSICFRCLGQTLVRRRCVGGRVVREDDVHSAVILYAIMQPPSLCYIVAEMRTSGSVVSVVSVVLFAWKCVW